jgi:hypothetical protein
LPEGAVQLARSAACEQQAFQFNDNVIGLQFHLETTPDSINSMIQHCYSDIITNKFIQTVPVIKSAKSDCFDKINTLIFTILNYITEGE